MKNKTIRIFRHIDCEGPAHLQTILELQDISFEIVRIDEGEKVKPQVDDVSGLIFMGGNMSVNDDYNWITDEIRLIQAAMQENIPVLGICLGSQLMAKAMGAKVYPGAMGCMELGWFPVDCQESNVWTKDLPESFDVFHWHGETFDLPKGATRLFSNEHYTNQGFAVGPHLALQFHVEMDSASVREWVNSYPDDIARRCVADHDATAMLDDLDKRIAQLQNYAEILFKQWLTSIVV